MRVRRLEIATHGPRAKKVRLKSFEKGGYPRPEQRRTLPEPLNYNYTHIAHLSAGRTGRSRGRNRDKLSILV